MKQNSCTTPGLYLCSNVDNLWIHQWGFRGFHHYMIAACEAGDLADTAVVNRLTCLYTCVFRSSSKLWRNLVRQLLLPTMFALSPASSNGNKTLKYIIRALGHKFKRSRKFILDFHCWGGLSTKTQFTVRVSFLLTFVCHSGGSLLKRWMEWSGLEQWIVATTTISAGGEASTATRVFTYTEPDRSDFSLLQLKFEQLKWVPTGGWVAGGPYTEAAVFLRRLQVRIPACNLSTLKKGQQTQNDL